MRKRMADVGALLLAVPGSDDEKEESGGYEDEADAQMVAKDAMRTFMDAVKADDVDGAMAAFKMLHRVCPMLPDEEEMGDEEPATESEED